MASTTAEVMLYYSTDDIDFERAVNALRFSNYPELTTREIIKLINPIWKAAQDASD